jgi:hypothetical protein
MVERIFVVRVRFVIPSRGGKIFVLEDLESRSSSTYVSYFMCLTQTDLGTTRRYGRLMLILTGKDSNLSSKP